MREVLRGGKKPKARLPKKEQAALPQGEESPDDEPTVTVEVVESAQALLADSPTPVAPSATDEFSALVQHFQQVFAQAEGRQERLKEFFLMVDDHDLFMDISRAVGQACEVLAAAIRQKIAEEKAKQEKPTREQRKEQERQADLERIQEELAKKQALDAKEVPENGNAAESSRSQEDGGKVPAAPIPEECASVNTIQECSRSPELPGVVEDVAGQRNDLEHAAECGFSVENDTDNPIGLEGFKPAVAVGDGNGNGCQAQQEDGSDKAAVLEQEAHGTDSLEVTETADAGVKPAMPGHRKRARHPPAPIVLEDGRCGHVVAGMGERTKRTMYGVRLENGGRAEVRKKLYATPANVGGMSLVPKAWLVDGEVSLDQVPAFLRGQAPAQESGGGEY